MVDVPSAEAGQKGGERGHQDLFAQQGKFIFQLIPNIRHLCTSTVSFDVHNSPIEISLFIILFVQKEEQL